MMNNPNPFENLFQHLTPEFLKANLKKLTDKFGIDVNISDEQIQELLKTFQETLAKAEEMRQDAVTFKEELEKLITNSKDGNGNFSAEYFYQAVSDLDKRIQEADLRETDRSILEGLISGTKKIVAFWVDKNA